MKKFFMSLAVCGTLFIMAACSSNVDKATDIIEKATTELKNTQTIEEAYKVVNAAKAEIVGLKLSDGDMEKLDKSEAYKAFEKACSERNIPLVLDNEEEGEEEE